MFSYSASIIIVVAIIYFPSLTIIACMMPDAAVVLMLVGATVVAFLADVTVVILVFGASVLLPVAVLFNATVSFVSA